MKLSNENFEKARAWILSHAREVDQSFFKVLFEDAPSSLLIESLSTYQNPDGGFGNALEPDFRLDKSSPMATTIAFQYLRDVNASEDQSIVQLGIKYFLESYSSAIKTWVGVPPEVNEAPHAPWWHVEEEELIDREGQSVIYHANPSAEIVGYLNQYREWVPEDFLQAVTQQAVRNFDLLEDPIEQHTLICYFRMVESLGEPERSILIERLQLRSLPTIPLDPQEWAAGYLLKPHLYIPTPDHALADFFPEAVMLSLEHEISKQSESGYWEPNWEWGQYDDIWRVAKQEWRGFLTAQNLKILNNYGMIENSSRE